uniref:Putative alpha/beta-hydrolase n=1 Tax=Moniliophthora roreri TaxID=221103 RepID=A0A0W0F093_MONRR
MSGGSHETLGFVKSGLKIPSKTSGWNLDAWRYLPSHGHPKKHPVIVMFVVSLAIGHGWSCNKLMSLAIYAERFTTLGYGCLVFDYRRWGDSDGIPRNIINVKEPLEDYRTVIE